MAEVPEKDKVVQLIHDSILNLCRFFIPAPCDLEVDAIVCIAQQNSSDIVVKVHKRLDSVKTDVVFDHMPPPAMHLPLDAIRGTLALPTIGPSTANNQENGGVGICSGMSKRPPRKRKRPCKVTTESMTSPSVSNQSNDSVDNDQSYAVTAAQSEASDDTYINRVPSGCKVNTHTGEDTTQGEQGLDLSIVKKELDIPNNQYLPKSVDETLKSDVENRFNLDARKFPVMSAAIVSPPSVVQIPQMLRMREDASSSANESKTSAQSSSNSRGQKSRTGGLQANMPQESDWKQFQRQLECPICGRRYGWHHHLNRHIQSHQNQGKKPKVFHCGFDNCVFSTSTKQHLTDHVLKHFDERPYKCGEAGCTTAFKNKAQAYAHFKSYHGCPTVHICPNCVTCYSSDELLYAHQRECPSPGHTCPQCGCMCVNKILLAKHLADHFANVELVEYESDGEQAQ